MEQLVHKEGDKLEVHYSGRQTNSEGCLTWDKLYLKERKSWRSIILGDGPIKKSWKLIINVMCVRSLFNKSDAKWHYKTTKHTKNHGYTSFINYVLLQRFSVAKNDDSI